MSCPRSWGSCPIATNTCLLRSFSQGERSGQRAVLSVDRFNQLAAGGDMNAILMNAVAAQQRRRLAQPRRRGRGIRDELAEAGWSGACRIVGAYLPPRRPPGAAITWDEVQQLRSEGGVPAAESGRPQDQGALRPVGTWCGESPHHAS